MEALFILVPLSLVALGVAIWIFVRMSAGGQFDDSEGPAYSILLDDDSPGARGRGPADTSGAGGADGPPDDGRAPAPTGYVPAPAGPGPASDDTPRDGSSDTRA